MARVPRRRDTYHHGDLKRALIDEALALVEEKGVAGLTLRETARRVGVTQAAPYRHFADKEALVAAVAEEGFRTMLDRIRRTLASAPANPLARLQAIGASYARFAADQPARFRVMFGREVATSHGHTGVWDAAQASFGELLREIAAAQRAGVLPAGDPRRAARATWSAVHGLAFLLVDGLLERQRLGTPARVEALAREVVAAVFEGLSASRPTRGSR
jgi:AcrR family transcriptional regulator